MENSNNQNNDLSKRVCAVVVTYHPDNEFKQRFLRIKNQVDAAVIVDNKSSEEELDMLRAIADELSDCFIIENDENKGIATALNQGVRFAKEKGFEWVLLFDQDTVVEPFLTESLFEVYDAFLQKDKIAVIGSNYIDTYTHKNVYGDENEKVLWIEKKTIITSGSLMPVGIFEKVGYFRDKFFIDHVDDEFCLRAKHKGYKVILAMREVMQHSLGASTMHRLLWRQTGTSNHSAFRRYYMTRNHVILVKEYFTREPAWVFNTVFSRFKSMILMCLYEKQRVTKFKAILKGLKDAVF